MGSFVKNSVLYLTATVCLKAASFLLLPLYSNLITPDAYGKVYVISSLITFLTLFLTFSMNSSIQRFFFDCKTGEEVCRMFSTVLYSVFSVSTIVVLALFAFISPAAQWLDVPNSYIAIALLTVYFSVFYNLIIALLYAKQEAGKISVASIIVGVLQIVAQLILVLNMKDKAFAMILAFGVGGVLHLVLFLFFSIKYITFVFDKASLRKYTIYGFSQFPSDISTWIVSFFDRIILNKYQNSAAVGIYGMGHTLASVPNVLFQSMNKALSPIVFDNYKQSETAGLDVLRYSAAIIEKIFVLITVLVCIIAAFSNNIVHILSSNYSQSGIVMLLVLIAVLIDIYRILFMYPLAYNVKYVKVKSTIWVLASIASILLNLVFIPKYSYLGACITLIIVNSITFFLIDYYSRKAIAPPYQSKKLFLIFIVSLAFAFTFFIGNGWWEFAIKSVLLLVYMVMLRYIYPIDIFKLLKTFKSR